jgi:hypothetical protein
MAALDDALRSAAPPQNQHDQGTGDASAPPDQNSSTDDAP